MLPQRVKGGGGGVKDQSSSAICQAGTREVESASLLFGFKTKFHMHGNPQSVFRLKHFELPPPFIKAKMHLLLLLDSGDLLLHYLLLHRLLSAFLLLPCLLFFSPVSRSTRTFACSLTLASSLSK